VVQAMPFQFIGLGPVLMKEGKEVIKSWICLFTCLAVHLYIYVRRMGKDLIPEQFLFCLRRFVARHGKPQSVISNNAKVVKTAID